MDPLVIRLDFLEFPPIHTCDGADVSPRIRISGLRSKTLAVMAVNPFQPSCCSFCPWLIWNIPAREEIPASIPPEGVVEIPVRAIQGRNDHGRIGYSGPCPSPGSTHRYTFKVYGLDDMLTVKPGATKSDLISGMRGHVRQYGETAALCSR